MQITSVSGVIEQLGGYREASELVGATPHASLMWRARGYLPRRTFILITQALALKGHTAPPRLWRMDVGSPRRKRRNGA
jgi:hypothetical protein